MGRIVGYFLLALAFQVIVCVAKEPNIIFILTDDQDVFMGSMTPMNKTKTLIGDAGITFNNMFVSNPLCCPSRSSILTGKYTHNDQAVNNTISGNCSSPMWQKTQETQSFAAHLHDKAGYRTFFAGKYLNQYGKEPAGGVKHVPAGWDKWYGLVGNSRYYNYTLSNNGKEEKHGDKYPQDYLTEVIASRAMDFLNDEASNSQPFFMMLSTPACHAPFTPSPHYNESFSKVKAPRTKAFGVKASGKHWLVQQATSPKTNDTLNYIDNAFRNRWRTLLTVDDIVENIVNKLKAMGVLDNTYIVFSSDNGYHLGQFSLTNDKRHLYEFDIRVPLMIRGPGVKAGQKRKEIVLNIDLAPTFMDLAGLAPPDQMDGRSIKPLLNTSSSKRPDGWREDFMVEHNGEYGDETEGCPQYNNQKMSICEVDCTCEDSWNNTYGCVRSLSDSLNVMYCQFADTVDFVEVYNLTADMDQMTNVAGSMDPKVLLQLNQRLIQLAVCSGAACRATGGDWLQAWSADHSKHAERPESHQDANLLFAHVQRLKDAGHNHWILDRAQRIVEPEERHSSESPKQTVHTEETAHVSVEDSSSFYGISCKDMLWFLFHMLKWFSNTFTGAVSLLCN